MGLFFDNDLTNFMQNQLRKLNESSIWIQIVDNNEVKDFIVSLNTDDQLLNRGIDSTGRSLKDIGGNDLTASGYSPFTIEEKKKKGGKAGKFDNITLYDKGIYHGSHTVKVTGVGFSMDANPNRGNTNLFEEWGKDILGLTDESLQKLINKLRDKYIIYTRNVLFART